LDSFDILHTVNQGAQIESALCGTEFTNKPQQIMYNPWINGVAYEGNPIMMGSWSWGTAPPWFILFHELGHDFTLPADRFRKLYPSAGYVSVGGDDWHFGTDFTEAWASMVGLCAMHEMFTNPSTHGIIPNAAANLQQALDASKLTYVNELATYEAHPDNAHLYPDLLDGIFFTLADSFGYDIFRRWFRILQPPNASWARLDSINASLDYADAKTTSFTITSCAFSVAARSDLRALFVNRWDFPIDSLLYAQVQPEIALMINGSAEVKNTRQATPSEFKIVGNYPNPFNPTTSIVFQLSRRSWVHVNVFNILGELVRSINGGDFDAGTQQIDFDGSTLPSGAYFYSVITSLGVRMGKCTLLK
jgi:hypothetical protein